MSIRVIDNKKSRREKIKEEEKQAKEEKKKLKEERVYDNLLTDTLPRKIKKCFLKISPKLFYKLTK